MTREEAITHGKEQLEVFGGEHREFIDMAIKALEQEPSKDAVSRQAILDMATTIQTDDYSGNEIMEVVDIDDVKGLPPVTPIQKWISVSERLPEKNGRYLAYIINKHDTNYQYIMTCEYIESDIWCWYPDDDCASDNVVAWMPLPEPYKAESEE